MNPRRATLWRAATGVWMALILVASVLPGTVGAPSGTAWHIAGYAVLAALLERWCPVWLAAVVGWGYGAAIEGVQALLTYRAAEVKDLAVNAAGVGVGLIAARLWRRMRPQA